MQLAVDKLRDAWLLIAMRAENEWCGTVAMTEGKSLLSSSQCLAGR